MLHAGTIFLSSFLLFLVQPLIARLILPWFGGSAAVWTTCMLFFQALLLAGYAYAHWLAKLSNKKLEAGVHSLLLLAAVLTLPIAPSDAWKPAGEDEPVSRILLLLGASVGLPYFLLAATSPLLQAWFARARPGENPYRLFAVSNLASLVALIGYPFLVEPLLGGVQQVAVWSWLFTAFAVLCAAVAWMTPKEVVETLSIEEVIANEKDPYVLWLALAATGSVLLLAVTNHLTQNVASMPLLWLAPLTLYLASFIVTFEGKGWYRPEYLWPILLVWIGAMGWLIVENDFQFDLPLQLGIFLPGLFLGCLFCHGELYRLRPAPSRLTAFYLAVSAGGALGGLLVAVVAPLAFTGYYELGIGLVVLALLAVSAGGALGGLLVAVVAPLAFTGYYELGIGLVVLALLAAVRLATLNIWARYASLAVLLGIAACAAYDGFRYQRDVLVASRSFYGVLRVKEYGTPGEEGHLRRLVHGAIMHGEQYLHESSRRMLTTYYHEDSGIGAAIRSLGKRPARVGVIGLGTGTIAAYGRPGDVYRFYEIDARVIRVAQEEFTYLGDSPAKIELALGDARLALEREAPQGFDVLAVDAFSSDAIPVHLITREALGVYLKHVKPNGIIAFHLSNRFLDLIPVVARLAREHGAHVVLVSDDPDEEEDPRRSRTDWVLVSRDAAALKRKAIVERSPAAIEDKAAWRTWTDDYSNLIQILK